MLRIIKYPKADFILGHPVEYVNKSIKVNLEMWGENGMTASIESQVSEY